MNAFRYWWRKRRAQVLRLVGLVASYASILGLLWIFKPTPTPVWLHLVLVISALLFVAIVFLELEQRPAQSIFNSDDRAGIRKYMHKWIEDGGRVAIWSRDLTWAQTTETEAMLVRKAQNGELIICLPAHTDLSRRLAAKGADVWIYFGGEYTPASRFTITHYQRAGSRVAVGHAQGQFHVIDEFDSRDHPAFYLAEDLVTLVKWQRGVEHGN